MQYKGGHEAALRKSYSTIFTGTSLAVKRTTVKPSNVEENNYPNFAVMEIFAFSTFDTGQPFSAASAYF